MLGKDQNTNKEIEEICARKLSDALSKIIDKHVVVELTTDEHKYPRELIKWIEKNYTHPIIIAIEITGGVNGLAVLIFREDTIAYLIKALKGQTLQGMEILTMMDKDLLKEVATMLVGNYISEFSNMLGEKLDVSIPVIFEEEAIKSLEVTFLHSNNQINPLGNRLLVEGNELLNLIFITNSKK